MSSTKPIQYIVGDATRPSTVGNKIIAHVCNDVGRWGKGFVLALSKRWTKPEQTFRAAGPLSLGTLQLVQVETDIWAANMVAQTGIKPQAGVPPIRYDALRRCLSQVAVHAKETNATFHMPRIGCGLAGGKWELVEPIIKEELGDVPVFVYDLPS